ncbi:hypothetical protein GCM10012275_04930 [Longimycelium tulufanense]|uniref:DUF2267 domain-containing protein n=1 Tax=Longimycelium tulufanense TaxID=907463 RepID=A0A8J3FUN6_9PSEU|nr:DUF2267 domain-containing protein [Longimycelium tulufanense]GGM36808.1 hypothetical protein GCM10012275_04930 [Longimycelium tulufanense]
MKHDEFIGQVQNRARLGSRGDAERATRATLETLGERLPEGLAENLAAQLPREVGEHLRRTEVFGGVGTGERFGLDEFVARVHLRSGASEPQAAFQARAVLAVVRDATSPGLMAKVRESLPDEVRSLVEAGGTGDMTT